jgi:hypothetical protein
MNTALRILMLATAACAVAVGSTPALRAQESGLQQGPPSDEVDCKREMLAAALAAHQQEATLETLSSSTFGVIDFQSSPSGDDSYVVTVRTAGPGGAATDTYRVKATRRCKILVAPDAG